MSNETGFSICAFCCAIFTCLTIFCFIGWGLGGPDYLAADSANFLGLAIIFLLFSRNYLKSIDEDDDYKHVLRHKDD